MVEQASIAKLKEFKSALLAEHGIARIRVFDPDTDPADSGAHIGVLLGFNDVPSLFDLSSLQNELQDILGIQVDIAVEGMMEDHWSQAIEEQAVEV